jgi:hypothetical protein
VPFGILEIMDMNKKSSPPNLELWFWNQPITRIVKIVTPTNATAHETSNNSRTGKLVCIFSPIIKLIP